MKAIYFDCFSGASGDMILGALVDAGASESRIRRNLDALGLKSWDLRLSEVQRGSIRSMRAEVIAQDEGTERSHKDIIALLAASSCESGVVERAKMVFGVLAQAESHIHSTPVDEALFHEVGGLDAIVDIVGCCAAIEDFLPAQVVTSPVVTGTGTVQTEHGVLPLPVPAVTELLQTRGAVLSMRGNKELITPTGAALLTTFTDTFGFMPDMRLEATGYGAGAADLEVPNVLRVCIGELAPTAAARRNETVLIDTNLDDTTPELIPYIIDSLLTAGAYDAWVTPIVMKKGRPGFTLSVLCAPVKKWHMMEIMFRETTTLGLRVSSVERSIADRGWADVEVEGAIIRVKIGSRNGDIINRSPELDDVLTAARITGLPAKEIYSRALQKAIEHPLPS